MRRLVRLETRLYVGRYISIFRSGMKKKFGELNYIDLFAGPGKCRIRGTREVRNGTPLIAAEHGLELLLRGHELPCARLPPTAVPG